MQPNAIYTPNKIEKSVLERFVVTYPKPMLPTSRLILQYSDQFNNFSLSDMQDIHVLFVIRIVSLYPTCPGFSKLIMGITKGPQNFTDITKSLRNV